MSPAAEAVGIVIPTYKEGENIAALLRELARAVPGARLVVVDDSPDLGTVEAVAGAGVPGAAAVHREGKGGRGSAVLLGLSRLLDAGCGRLVELDADFSHPPAQLPALLAEARERGLDLLIASRYLPGSRIENWPLSRRLFSRFSNGLARLLLRVPVADYTNGYRIYSRRGAELVVARCGRLGKGFIILSEILLKVHGEGLRIGESPTVFVNRLRGESSVNGEELKNAAVGLAKLCLYKWGLAYRGVRPA